jgi:hypothetical protein
MNKHDVDIINKRLENLYGKELDGRQKFRLVWSSSQLEVRVGEFSVYSGGIFLRTETGAREVPKYGYAPERWILEKTEYHPVNPELLRSESYEPIWIFQDEEGNALDPVWRAVEMVVHAYLNPPPKRSEKDFIRTEQEKKAKEVEVYYDMISSNSPYLATMLHNKEATFIDSTKRMTDKGDTP